MTGLAIDTSGQRLTLTLWNEKDTLASCSLEAGRKQADLIAPELNKLLEQAVIKIGDINVAAVATGPGAFTGLRVGISFAKGLGVGLGIKLMALDTLDAMAWSLSDFRGTSSPMLDAKKGQIYTALYSHGSDEPARMRETVAIEPGQWLEGLEPGTVLFGSGVDSYRSLIGKKPGLEALEPNIASPTVAGLVRLARKIHSEGAFVGPAEIDANYIRPADAELKPRAGKL